MHIKKIMIVDDLPGVAYTVKYGLEKLDSDFNVLRVESGKKCLELLENNQIPDLILLDIMMPEMNGWEVARKLRENLEWRKTPIIFISAIGDRTSKIASVELAEEFIEKPFDMKDLKIKIDEILKK